jgi:hypothetical protein
MKAAPAVTVRLHRFSAWNRGVAALTVLALVAVVWLGWMLVPEQAEPQQIGGFQAQNGLQASWILGLPVLDWAVLGWASLSLAAIGLAVGRLWQTRPVTLAWNGQHWQLDGAPEPWQVLVTLDLGFLLLLRASRPGSRVRWVPVLAPQSGTDLHGLRVALFAQSHRAANLAAQPLSL